MRIPFHASLTSIALACVLVASPATRAATANADTFTNAASCQLSIPTTNTGVRPKATGFRNESTTTSNFVICPVMSSPGNLSVDAMSVVYIIVYSLDGKPHDVSCTAVSGWYGSPSRPPVYSSKTASAATSGQGNYISWTTTDFGGSPGTNIAGSINFSVTCNLPPQSAINFLEAHFPYNIGS